NLISHHVLPRIKHHVQRAANKPSSGSQPMGGLSQMLASSQAMHTSQLMHLSQLAPPGSTPVGMGVPPGMMLTAPLDLSALLAGVLSGPPAARQQVARMFADPGSYKLDQAME